jgi:hypothetical protein
MQGDRHVTITTEYKKELEAQHSGAKNWGVTAVKYTGGEVMQQLLVNGQIQEVCDIGCGKQALLPMLQKYFPVIKYVPYDPGIPGIDIPPKGRYGLVTCIDVLEHCEKGLLDELLTLIGSRTKYTAILDVACYPTGKVFESGPYEGEDLHITIHEPNWWVKRVVKVLGDEFSVQKYASIRMAPIKGVQRPRALIVLNRKY